MADREALAQRLLDSAEVLGNSTLRSLLREAAAALSADAGWVRVPSVTEWQLCRSMHFLGLDNTTYYPPPTPYRRFDEMVKHVFQKAIEMEPENLAAAPGAQK